MSDYKKIIKGKSDVTSESSAAELMLRARQFLDFPEIVGMHNSSDKYRVFKELIDSLVGENKEKVIVFSQYTNTINYLIKNLKADGYNDILLIDGSVESEERQEICRKFNGDDIPYILIMSDAGATGLNLQTAKSVIHFTDSYSPAIMQQRNDRAHRATTKHTVNIYRFICDGTVEENVRNILGKKMVVNNAMLDEKCTEFELSGMTALELLSCL
jgi:SNF2 family DNA or RNA helicase